MCYKRRLDLSDVFLLFCFVRYVEVDVYHIPFSVRMKHDVLSVWYNYSTVCDKFLALTLFTKQNYDKNWGLILKCVWLTIIFTLEVYKHKLLHKVIMCGCYYKSNKTLW